MCNLWNTKKGEACGDNLTVPCGHMVLPYSHVMDGCRKRDFQCLAEQAEDGLMSTVVLPVLPFTRCSGEHVVVRMVVL